jgi:hypothetical protein
MRAIIPVYLTRGRPTQYHAPSWESFRQSKVHSWVCTLRCRGSLKAGKKQSRKEGGEKRKEKKVRVGYGVVSSRLTSTRLFPMNNNPYRGRDEVFK